jgi:glycosyltransferase involved in cell wall biosynthesis
MAEAAEVIKQRDNVRIALLIHDLLPATSPQWFADAQGQAAKREVETLIGTADEIFSVSTEVATELQSRYGKTATLLMPADPELRSVTDSGRDSLVQEERTVLSVGTFHPRKNLVALVRIWDAWVKEV